MDIRRVGARGRVLLARLETPAFVTRLDDLAVMCQAVEQGRSHLGIAEHARPFTEVEVGGDDDRGALVEAADNVEQELPACLSKGQVAQFKSSRVR
jgi:hypothetical protein